MKKLKFYLTAIVTMIIVAISSQAYAHGSQVDSANAITMPGSLSNGKGTVSSSISGAMSFQFVEISSNKYAAIKKYETICNLISAYINQSSNYDSLASSYESTYNQTANGIMTEYGIQFNQEGYNAIRGLWVAELTTYNASAWTSANGNTIELDLTTFSGTKYYIAWVKIGDTYDAEAYKVTGTKSGSDSSKDNTSTETKTDNTTKTTGDGNKTSSTNTTVLPSALPKTGLSNYILFGLIVTFVITGTIAYVKYRKIK